MDLHSFPITPKVNRSKSKLASSRKKTSLKDSKSCLFDIRSTPSGSPILKKKLPTVRKVLSKTGNLVPISPITPGSATVGHSFNKSCFSFHVTDGSINKASSFDNTILAVPLDASDDDVTNPLISEDESETITSAQHLIMEDDDCITAPSTNDQSTIGTISQVASESITSPTPPSSKPRNADIKGSSWLESVCDNINKERKHEEKSISEKISNEICDSAKKLKIKRGGLAEQLLKVLKKTNSEQAIFMHQIKANPCSISSNILELQVISSQTEGQLYILECKICNSDEYYTILLSKEIVEKHEIQLTSRFKIFPSWFEQKMEGHNHPVLLSVTKIITSEEATGYHISEPSNSPRESLLSAIQHPSIAGFVNIVATVQRICVKVNSNSELINSVVLEDGFGVFMELVVDDELCNRTETKDVFIHGEGQRIVVHNVSVEGRVTKTQLPSLFEIIESVWSCNGQGLMHVNQSQSQEMQIIAEEEIIYPPSFCYLLSAETSRSRLSLMNDPIKTDLSTQFKLSDLNRPRNDSLSQCDVLYKPSEVVTLENISTCSGRVSILCKLIYHFYTQINSPHILSGLRMLVADDTTSVVHQVEVLMTCAKDYLKLSIGSSFLLKDVSVKSDSSITITMDAYSRLHFFNENEINQVSKITKMSAESLHEKLLSLNHANMPETFPTFDNSTKPYSLVTVKGCIKKVAYTSNKFMHCTYCGNEEHINKHENCVRCGQEMLFRGSKAPCVLITLDDNIQLAIKLLRKTWTNLTQNVLKLADLKLVYGQLLGPLTCAIYQNNEDMYLNEISLL